MNDWKTDTQPPEVVRNIAVNTAEVFAAARVRSALLECLAGQPGERELVLLCIGTDRATGDSLGPLTGHKLEARLKNGKTPPVGLYGTLEHPIHAQNLRETLSRIQQLHKNPLVIAVDACLGRVSRIGWLTVAQRPMHPGAGVRKTLPSVGDISIAGVVNFGGAMELMVLQNTRLFTVMRMADAAADGIAGALETRSAQGGAEHIKSASHIIRQG